MSSTKNLTLGHSESFLNFKNRLIKFQKSPTSKLNNLNRSCKQAEDPQITMLSNTSTTTLKYKSKYFIHFSFLMLVLSQLPVQYHNENFEIQMKKMQDSCAESYGYFNDNQTHILDTLFPYGFSSALSFDSLYQELKSIDEIHKKKSLNNITIKYLSQSECLSKNYTNIINMITVSTSKTITHTTNSNLKKYEIKQQIYHQLPSSNIILVCDDESYKKSLINTYKYSSLSSKLSFESQFLNGMTAMDFLDYQPNVIAQVKFKAQI